MSGRLLLRLDYEAPGEVLRAFRQSDAVARGVFGPMGGGRKVCVLHDIVIRAFAARQRQHRWIIAAAGADQVTQVADRVNEWLPPGVAGDWDEKTWRRQLKVSDGTHERLFDFQFLALDRPEHRRRFGSAEVTGFWLAAARDLDEAVFQTAFERAGSWPSAFDGGGRKQIICTSRVPREDHWLVTRRDLALFHQPGGRTPEAENIEPRGGLKRDAYQRAAEGMDPSRVATEIDAEWMERPDEDLVAVDPDRVALAVLWAIRGGLRQADPPGGGLHRPYAAGEYETGGADGEDRA